MKCFFILMATCNTAFYMYQRLSMSQSTFVAAAISSTNHKKEEPSGSSVKIHCLSVNIQIQIFMNSSINSLKKKNDLFKCTPWITG